MKSNSMATLNVHKIRPDLLENSNDRQIKITDISIKSPDEVSGIYSKIYNTLRSCFSLSAIIYIFKFHEVIFY